MTEQERKIITDAEDQHEQEETLLAVLEREHGDDIPENMSEEDLLFLVEEKLSSLNRVFKDPVLEARYRALLENEDHLLSLDEEIAKMKIRFGQIVVQKNKNMEISSSLRALVDAVGQAYDMRERAKEYVHLEQLLYLMNVFYEIAEQEITRPDDLKRIHKRYEALTLPRREHVPIEIRMRAKQLAQGMRADGS